MEFPKPVPQQNFKFTDTQRSELLESWVKENEKHKAEEFLNNIEPTIAYWMYIVKQLRGVVAQT